MACVRGTSQPDARVAANSGVVIAGQHSDLTNIIVGRPDVSPEPVAFVPISTSDAVGSADTSELVGAFVWVPVWCVYLLS